VGQSEQEEQEAMTDPTFPRCKIVRMHDGMLGYVMLAFAEWCGNDVRPYTHRIVAPSRIVECRWHSFGYWDLTIEGLPEPLHVVNWPEGEP
jgi:hypothetical protein